MVEVVKTVALTTIVVVLKGARGEIDCERSKTVKKRCLSEKVDGDASSLGVLTGAAPSSGTKKPRLRERPASLTFQKVQPYAGDSSREIA